MSVMKWSLALLLAPALAAQSISFEKQVRPILTRSCAGCHQPAAKQSGLSLASYAEFQKGGNKGAGFTPGDPDKSVIIAYLTGAVKPQMPFGGKPLPDDQIELIRQWIREGAKDDSTATGGVTVPKGPIVYHAPPVITAIAISPDGQTLAVSGYHEILLEKLGGEIVARLPGLSERLHTLIFTPDGKTLV